MAVAGVLVDVGFLSIAGFGTWRGQNLWSRHIELKHERKMQELSVKRMKESAKLEMALTRNLAEIEGMKEVPALSSGDSGDLSGLPFVCGCGSHPSWHLHALRGGQDHALSLSMRAIVNIKEGRFHHLCVCNDYAVVHNEGPRPKLSLVEAGYVVRR